MIDHELVDRTEAEICGGLSARSTVTAAQAFQRSGDIERPAGEVAAVNSLHLDRATAVRAVRWPLGVELFSGVPAGLWPRVALGELAVRVEVPSLLAHTVTFFLVAEFPSEQRREIRSMTDQASRAATAARPPSDLAHCW